MQVKPTGPGQPREPGAKRPAPLAHSKPLEGASPPEKGRVLEPADQVEISGAARELSGALAASSADEGALEPGRLREILERIADGYYERSDVQEQVLRKVARELGLEIPRS